MRKLYAGVGMSVLSLLLLGAFALPAAATVDVLNDCPSASGVLSAAINLPLTNPSYPLSVGYTNTVGNTFVYTLTTPAVSSTGGIPGVLEYCVYPTDSTGTPTGVIPVGTTDSTTAVGADSSAWTAGFDCSSSCANAIRPNGNPSNIPYGSGTTTVLTVNWGSATNFLIVLHIIDATICGGGAANPNTCFVIPNGTPHFPPPPPPGVPQFPIGGLLIVAAAMIPVALLLRRRALPA